MPGSRASLSRTCLATGRTCGARSSGRAVLRTFRTPGPARATRGTPLTTTTIATSRPCSARLPTTCTAVRSPGSPGVTAWAPASSSQACRSSVKEVRGARARTAATSIHRRMWRTSSSGRASRSSWSGARRASQASCSWMTMAPSWRAEPPQAGIPLADTGLPTTSSSEVASTPARQMPSRTRPLPRTGRLALEQAGRQLSPDADSAGEARFFGEAMAIAKVASACGSPVMESPSHTHLG
mmetsp:Transcript_55859/g.125894  ORF Transcript_55859/g.125894 Transcript_55859/m.125894 type:complete len:240 (+) Transcript_55859:133-852(+)